MADSEGLPPWVWVGCGCVGAIVALVVVVAGVGFWGARQAQELAETMSDPEARTEKSLEILGANALPDGYYAVAAFSIPYVLDVTVLSDEPPAPDGTPHQATENGFVFTSFPAIGEGDDELYDFFEGRTDDVDALKREQFNVDLKERLTRGRMERDEDEILWVSHRGSVDTENTDAHDGLVTMMLFECNDDRRRVGIWFGPDPDPASAADTLDLSGTVADVSEIEVFLRPVTPCR